jgi:hypothetical protein
MVGTSDSEDSEDGGEDCEDVAELTCLPLLLEEMQHSKWLIRVRNAAGDIGFLCRCCRASQSPGKWCTKPCYPNLSYTTGKVAGKVRKQPIKRHADSKVHRTSYENYVNHALVMTAMISRSHSESTLNLRKQLRIAEFIAMRKLSLDMYPQMMILNLKLGLFGSNETALYKGLDAGKEMIEALASATRAVMQERWSRASEIGVTIDETTDRSVKSQMIMFYKYYLDGVLYEDCAGIEQLPNGKAQTVMAALLHHLKKDNISVAKVTFFGTDGAGVMVGSKKGVHKRFSQLNSNVIGYHCALHRWSLVCKHAAGDITNMKHFFDIFEALARHYSFSATRRWELHQQQRALDIKEQELVEACFTRWLTHDKLTEALHDSLPAVVSQLRDEVASDKADSVQAVGFLAFLTCEDTLFYLMCVRDVVPVLTHLSVIVQGVDVDLMELKRQIEGVVLKLDRFIHEPGSNVSAFGALCEKIQNLVESPLKRTPWHVMETTRISYLLALIQNINAYFPCLPIMAHFNEVLNPVKFLPLLGDDVIPNQCFRAILTHYEGSLHLRDVTRFDIAMEWSVWATFARFHKDDKVNVVEEYVEDEVALVWDYAVGKPPVLKRTVEKSISTQSLILMFLATSNIEAQNPSMCKIMRIYLAFTITTASCERGFSVLKLTKTALRTSLGQPFLDMLICLGHIKEDAPESTISLAVQLFISQKDRRFRSNYDMPTFEEESKCARIRMFKWGDTMNSQHIEEEKTRFESAPGSSLPNPRLETGVAASSSSLYARARALMKINSAFQGRDVPAPVAAQAPPPSITPVPRRSGTSAAVARPAVAPVLPAAAVQSILAPDVHGVDSIHDVKVVNLKLHYFVKWTGYDVGNNTWEPEEHIMDPALINIFKVQFSSAYRDANAEITRRKQEKMRKTIMEPEAPAVSVEVFSRTGRPIVRPAAMRE